MPAVPLAARRIAFLIYACVLFGATHWPALEIQGPVPRTDLWLHVIAFTTWTALFGFAEFVAPFRERTTPLLLVPCALVYAAVDEALQAVPVLNRHASFDDYTANAVGVFLGAAIVAIAGRVLPTTPTAHKAP